MMKGGNIAIVVADLVISLFLTTPAFALDLNAYRRAHKLPPLAYSAELAWTVQARTDDLASPPHGRTSKNPHV